MNKPTKVTDIHSFADRLREVFVESLPEDMSVTLSQVIQKGFTSHYQLTLEVVDPENRFQISFPNWDEKAEFIYVNYYTYVNNSPKSNLIKYYISEIIRDPDHLISHMLSMLVMHKLKPASV